MLGNVAELATANIFFAKDGVVYTPAANGTFLTGITRHRTIKLLRDAGVTVVEGSFRYSDFQNADEIFSTGNYSKLMPIIASTTARSSRGRSIARRASSTGTSRTAEGGHDVRPCANAEEMRAAFAPIWHYFGQLPPTDDAIKHFARVLEPERVHAGFDGDASSRARGRFTSISPFRAGR